MENNLEKILANYINLLSEHMDLLCTYEIDRGRLILLKEDLTTNDLIIKNLLLTLSELTYKAEYIENKISGEKKFVTAAINEMKSTLLTRYVKYAPILVEGEIKEDLEVELVTCKEQFQLFSKDLNITEKLELIETIKMNELKIILIDLNERTKQTPEQRT